MFKSKMLMLSDPEFQRKLMNKKRFEKEIPLIEGFLSCFS